MIDPTTDKGGSLRGTLLRKFAAPNYVKQAEREDYEALPQSAFAGPGKLYPVHNKAAAWWSIAYFLQNRGALPKDLRGIIEPRLKKVAQIYGIDYQDMQRRAQESPAKPRKFALDEEWRGERIQLYPLDTPQQIHQAAESLYRYRHRIPYIWRRKAACALLESAKEQSIHLDNEDYFLKAAGLGVCPPEQAAKAILTRSLMADDPEIRQGAYEYAAQIAREPFSKEAHQQHLQVLAMLDETLGLTRYYGKGLNTPEEELCSHLFKEAADILEGSVLLQDGKPLYKDQLKGVELDKVAAALGERFLKEALGEGLIVTEERFLKAAEKLPAQQVGLLRQLLPKSAPRLERWAFLIKGR